MIGHAGSFGGVIAQRYTGRRHLGLGLVGNPDGISANSPCCFFATWFGKQDHVEERPPVISAVVVGARTAVAAVMRDRPVRPRKAFQHVFLSIFGTRSIEVARGEYMVRVRKRVLEARQMLVGRFTHLGGVVGRGKMDREAG